MTRFVDLIAVEGPDKGMRYSIEENTYRVLARAGDDGTSTRQITPEGDLALDGAQEKLVDEVLAARARGTRMQFRKRGPDIVLTDGSVSRAHALVFVDRSSVSVVDLMSTNGTRVNGAPIRDVELRTDDVIQLGNTRLRLEDG